MKILYSPKFSRQYKKLTNEIKDKFEEREPILRANPFDNRLKTHKLNGDLADCWSFSIDYKIRVVFVFRDANTISLEFVGDHDMY